MNRKLLIFLACLALQSLYPDAEQNSPSQNPLMLLNDFEAIGNRIVRQTKRIWFHNYPAAYNPSLIRIDEGYLLTFRHHSDYIGQPWLSDIYIVRLNESLDPISEPQCLSTRRRYSKTPSQSEDARLFSYRGRTFLIFNDNIDNLWFSNWYRRDMFVAELFQDNGNFSLSSPQKLIFEEEYNKSICQKNWVPFEWDKTLLLSYTLDPHIVVYPNLKNGNCYSCYQTAPGIDWDFGTLRGGTPAILVDGEYLAFFHSAKPLKSLASFGHELWHYFAGAYTFSAEPPFEVLKTSPVPLVANGFYTQSGLWKRVIFPGGFTISGDTIYLAYGKDDCEIWIATIDKKALLDFLQPVKQAKNEGS